MRMRLVLLFGAAVAALALASPLGPISPVRPVFKPRLPPMTREDKSALALDADRPLGLPAGVSSILPPQLYETKASSGRSRPSGSSGISRAVDPYRLPEIIVPFAYDVFLAVDVDTFKYGGMVEIFINVLESTNTIVLHAGSNIQFEQNTVTVDTYKPASGEVVVDYTILRVERDATYETVTITLDKQLEKGKHYSIIFSEFESDILEGLFGFYRSSYVENGQTKWLATTQFESTHARKAFPCFDEPSFKARFDIAIAHDNQYTVRSNMPGTSSIMGFDEGRVSILTTFDTTVPMSTYLLAWVVSEFDHVSNADATFSTWSRKGTISGVGLSQDIGPKSLQQLGDFTGVPFVLPKTDQFAIPDFNAGAMENWGLVTYREEYLVKTDLTDIRIEHYMNIVVCHELAHQWSGNLVTMDWWSHTWLNEGFATFFENLICEAIKPSLKLMDKFVSMHAHVAMDYDLLTVGGPAMSSEVSTPDEIQSKFDTISYKKGGSVIRMFQHILTPDVFQKGLRRYFSANMYANSNPQLLFRALGAEAAAAPVGTVSLPAGVSFATMAESWTEQRGVPVVMVTRDYARNTVTFTQEELRLTEFGSQGRRWYVPVTYVTGDSADFSKTTPMAWLTPDKPSVTVQLSTSSADSWLLANPEGIAYYRVLYDSRNWQQLHAAIKKGVIPAASQSQIIGDALALARVGHLSWVDALQTLDVLVGNKQLDTTVWISAVKTLNLFTDYLANTDIYNAFLTLKHRYTEAAFEAAGLTVQPNDEHDHRYTRYYVAPFACSAGNKKCLKEANDQLKVWLQKPEEIILHADTATATLTYGVMGGDISTFQAVKSLLEQTEDTDVRSQLIKALTFSLDSQLITSLLSEALDSWVVKTDTTDLFSNLINRAQHHRLLFNYLKSNWQKIDLYYGDASSDTSLLLRIVAAWIRTVRSDAEYKEVSEWTEQTLKSRPGYGNYITKALSNVDDTLAGWHRKHYGDVSAYINSITDTPDSSTSAPTDRTTPSPPRTSGNPSAGSTSRIPPQPTGNPVTVTPPPSTTPNKAPLAGASSVLLGVATMASFLVARLQ